MAKGNGLAKDAFGSALYPDGREFAMIAQACSDCVEKVSQGRESMKALILGHVMAHELGHLLLGAGSHSATGLMHVPWHKKELEMVAQGSLLFTSWEGEKMRQQVLSRLGDQRWAQAARK